MKHEWKKVEKEIYQPKEVPQLIKVEKQKYFCIKGKGNPNETDFSDRVGVLYSLAYAVKMMPKKEAAPEGYYDFTLYPLEGVWDLSEEGIVIKEKTEELRKDELVYTIMIRQPDFVTEEVAQRALETVKRKKPHPLLQEAYFDEIEDGISVQLLHNGTYDSEPESFHKLVEFMEENHYMRRTMVHREIYLTDARKTEKDKLKTILRYQVCSKK